MSRHKLVIILAVILLWNGVGTAGESEVQERAMQWLLSQINPQTKLVASYADNPTCWLYDQALAVIAFSEAGGKYTQHARDILQFLQNNRNQSAVGDSCWFFSYEANGKRGAEYTTTGANAWIVMAVIYYETRTDDKSFRPMAEQTLGWIAHQCLKKINDIRGVVMSDRNYPETGYEDTKVYSTEHNLDAYSAFNNMGLLTGKINYVGIAADLKAFLTRVIWDGRRFCGGYSLPGGVDNTFYLDAQSWGVLALGPGYSACLQLAEEKCLVTNKTHNLNGKTVTGITGFTEWTGTKHFWAEGNEGMVAAWRVAGETNKVAFYHKQTQRFAEALDKDSNDKILGIPYASSNSNGASGMESVAGTAWFYFNERRVNPFRPPMKP